MRHRRRQAARLDRDPADPRAGPRRPPRRARPDASPTPSGTATARPSRSSTSSRPGITEARPGPGRASPGRLRAASTSGGRAEPLVREAANVRTAILREAETGRRRGHGRLGLAGRRRARGVPVRGAARGDRHPRPADGHRGQDPRDDRPADVRAAGRSGPRRWPRPIGRPRRPGRSRPGSSAGSASRTSTMRVRRPAIGWSRSRRSRA